MANQKNSNKSRPYVAKTITIRADQQELIEKRALNLSKFVQQKLDELK